MFSFLKYSFVGISMSIFVIPSLIFIYLPSLSHWGFIIIVTSIALQFTYIITSTYEERKQEVYKKWIYSVVSSILFGIIIKSISVKYNLDTNFINITFGDLILLLIVYIGMIGINFIKINKENKSNI